MRLLPTGSVILILLLVLFFLACIELVLRWVPDEDSDLSLTGETQGSNSWLNAAILERPGGLGYPSPTAARRAAGLPLYRPPVRV